MLDLRTVQGLVPSTTENKQILNFFLGVVAHTAVILALGIQRQDDPFKIKDKLVYTVSSRTTRNIVRLPPKYIDKISAIISRARKVV